LLGVTQAVHGQPIVELLRAPAFAELLPRVRAEGKASTELSVGAGTATRQVLSRGVLLAETGAVVVVMVDVTEIRRLEAVRRDFVANVSHELRTPVSIMRTNAEILLDGALRDAEKGPMFAHAIARSAERLGRIVADLLDLSRIESGALQLNPKPLVLHEVTERMVEGHQTQAKKRDITLEHAVPEQLDVLADEDALEAVLANLIDNALKYGASGGTVAVRARNEGPKVCIEVHDDGPGIELRHRQRIFERFYRVDPGRSRDMGGTGLGLSIVKHLVDSMQGSVEVVDNAPTGSVFRVWLPSAKPAQQP
jgi:two-component system phosphate regulon sensor histidine kinase PhoR